jgi:hypothetical protein
MIARHVILKTKDSAAGSYGNSYKVREGHISVRRSWLCQNDDPVLPDDLAHGLKLFNDAEFFEAHEALEEIWRATLGPERKFLQGLIQIAVGLHHHGRGNLVGARSVMKRAFRNLSAYPEDFGGINLPRLLCSLTEWQEAMENGTPVPPLPKIVVRGRTAVRKNRRKTKKD